MISTDDYDACNEIQCAVSLALKQSVLFERIKIMAPFSGAYFMITNMVETKLIEQTRDVNNLAIDEDL